MHPSVVHPRELRDFLPQGASPHLTRPRQNTGIRLRGHGLIRSQLPPPLTQGRRFLTQRRAVRGWRRAAVQPRFPGRAALPPWSRHQHLRQAATRASCASGGRRSNSGPMRWAAAEGPRSSASGTRSALPGIAVLVLERRQVVRREARTFRKVIEGQPQRLTTGPDFRAQLHAPERDPRMPPR